jgi:hypothetical protein
MNDMNDFIWIKENAVDSAKCKNLIDVFEHYDKSGLTVSRQQNAEAGKLQKEDCALCYNWAYGFGFEDPMGMTVSEEIMESFKEYSTEFSSLDECALCIKHFKIQKTKPGQGYHMWHHEAGNEHTSRRVAVFTLYLNDIDEGGETEFLYQSKRVSPKVGRIVWWPASFTHPHRGNPPLGDETKYIVTGWVEFQG